MTRQTSSRNKLTWTIAGLLVLTVCTSAAFARGNSEANDPGDEIIATVDGVPITVQEFKRAIQINKPRVMNYFHEKYDAEQVSSFWTTSIGGEVPLDKLQKAAFDESVDIKVRQMVAKEQGVLGDISYRDFLKQLEQENERRAKATAKGQVIYGPIQYNEEAYFAYIMTNAATTVKQKLEEKLRPDEVTLKSFYDQHKKELYAHPGEVKVSIISLSYLDSTQHIDQDKKEQAYKQLKEAETKLAAGVSFAKIAKSYSDPGTEQELIIHLGNVRQNSRSPVARAAESMEPGETSGIIDENGRLYILNCIAKTEPGTAYRSYDEIREQVRKDFIDSKYEEMICHKLSKAVVEVDQDLLNSLQSFESF